MINWVLVRRAVDYLAQDQAPRPLQHFWSLAVEEQFYLGWPLLVVGVVALHKRRWRASGDASKGKAGGASSLLSTRIMSRWSPGPRPHAPGRSAYAVPMTALCGASFLVALYYARYDPAAGYFMTCTRLHELDLGGLLGMWSGTRVPTSTDVSVAGPTSWSHRARTATAVAGLIAIGGSGFLYTTRLHFPGLAALVPALGAVAVVVAGESTDGGVRGDGAVVHALSRALAHPWLQYMGDISYSLYLAHWPVVVMYPFATGRPVDGVLADGAMVCLVSLALAHASKAVWEDRFRAPAPDKGGCPTLYEGGIPAFARKEAGATIAGAASDPSGDGIPELSTMSPSTCPPSKHRRSTLAGAVFMGLAMTSVTLSASLALHIRASSGTHTKPAAAALSTLQTNGTDPTRQLRCADYFGTNASHPFPGADALLQGCPDINRLSIADAVALVEIGKNGHVDKKPYPNVLEMTRRPPASPSGKKLFVMGGSHDFHWMPAFEIVAGRLGLKVFDRFMASCPPSFTPVIFWTKETGTQP